MIESSDAENLLSRFRQWLEEAHTEAEADRSERDPTGGNGEDREVGLYRLVEEFTALRHELKLQTKSTRGLQEQTEAVLPALRQAIEQFRAVEPSGIRPAADPGKSLAEALADLDEKRSAAAAWRSRKDGRAWSRNPTPHSPPRLMRTWRVSRGSAGAGTARITRSCAPSPWGKARRSVQRSSRRSSKVTT